MKLGEVDPQTQLPPIRGPLYGGAVTLRQDKKRRYALTLVIVAGDRIKWVWARPFLVDPA